MCFVLINEFSDFDVLEVRAGQSLVKVGKIIEDFLCSFIFIVVFDYFKVKFAADQLHLYLETLFEYNVL